MNDNKAKKLGTEPYKGVRDFYPDDMSVQNAIFNIWKNTVKKYGYVEYGASVLEPSELYKAKTGR
jgi:histidyl-tRNA synthetase